MPRKPPAKTGTKGKTKKESIFKEFSEAQLEEMVGAGGALETVWQYGESLMDSMAVHMEKPCQWLAEVMAMAEEGLGPTNEGLLPKTPTQKKLTRAAARKANQNLAEDSPPPNARLRSRHVRKALDMNDGTEDGEKEVMNPFVAISPLQMPTKETAGSRAEEGSDETRAGTVRKAVKRKSNHQSPKAAPSKKLTKPNFSNDSPSSPVPSPAKESRMKPSNDVMKTPSTVLRSRRFVSKTPQPTTETPRTMVHRSTKRSKSAEPTETQTPGKGLGSSKKLQSAMGKATSTLRKMGNQQGGAGKSPIPLQMNTAKLDEANARKEALLRERQEALRKEREEKTQKVHERLQQQQEEKETKLRQKNLLPPSTKPPSPIKASPARMPLRHLTKPTASSKSQKKEELRKRAEMKRAEVEKARREAKHPQTNVRPQTTNETIVSETDSCESMASSQPSSNKVVSKSSGPIPPDPIANAGVVKQTVEEDTGDEDDVFASPVANINSPVKASAHPKTKISTPPKPPSPIKVSTPQATKSPMAAPPNKDALAKKKLGRDTLEKMKPKRDSYEMTPMREREPSTASNYNINDLRSDDETDDDTAPRKEIPTWAAGESLKRALINQHINPPINPGDYFGPCYAPLLQLMFKQQRKKFLRRGSSAQWDSPLLQPPAKYFKAAAQS